MPPGMIQPTAGRRRWNGKDTADTICRTFDEIRGYLYCTTFFLSEQTENAPAERVYEVSNRN